VRTGGGLNFVVGPMGSGKTLFAVRTGIRALCSGQYWVTNVELLPDWADRTAHYVARFSSRSKRDRIAARLEHLYVFETDLAEARRYRLPPGRGEARGMFTWDEGHNDLNNRDWKKDGRAETLEWATQLRKLGYVGFLLTQHGDNTDVALRRIGNHVVRLQNQREQTRLLGLRVSPWPLFLAYWYPAHLGQAGQVIPATKVERYFLSWHRHLYDTFGLFHGLAEVDSTSERVIRLADIPRGVTLPRAKAGQVLEGPGSARVAAQPLVPIPLGVCSADISGPSVAVSGRLGT